jgi:hypothetical protein
MQTTNPPILFLIFNRPELTAKVFAWIKLVRPSHLYVAADGPRVGRHEDVAACDEARQIATKIDWPCELHIRFRDKNLGARVAVGDAIDWFFEKEEEGIILEDDCVPDLCFYRYCTELLERYRDDTRVMSISGDRSFAPISRNGESYSFSRFPLIWGWATWRRAWKKFDVERFHQADHRKVIRSVRDEPNFVRSWTGIFDAVLRKEVDSWGYIWTFSVWANSGLTVVPNVNLVTNIGFGPQATHTVDENDHRSNVAAHSIEDPLVHPNLLSTDPDLDNLIIRDVHGIGPVLSLPRRAVRKVKRMLT